MKTSSTPSSSALLLNTSLARLMADGGLCCSLVGGGGLVFDGKVFHARCVGCQADRLELGVAFAVVDFGIAIACKFTAPDNAQNGGEDAAGGALGGVFRILPAEFRFD